MTLWCADGWWSGVLARKPPSAGWVGALLLVCTVFLSSPSAAQAHVPVPDSVLNPESAPEAWNVLRLAVENVGRLIHEDRLVEVPDQASLCSPALRTLARLADGTPRQKEVAAATMRVGSSFHSLAQACVAGDHASIGTALDKVHATLDALAQGTDPKTVGADVFFCPMHPETVSLDGKAFCPKCGMALTPRRIPYSFVYVAPPGDPLLRMTAECDVPPQAGRQTRVKVRLTMRDGSPVGSADLLVAHTQRIHLLIVDSALEDYHHEHPTPTGPPGEYEFTFMPANTRPYRVYADVVPAVTGIQEYVPVDLPAADGSPRPERPRVSHQSTFHAEAGGLDFQLTTEMPDRLPPRAKQTCALQILIRKPGGEFFAALEPVMNSFAHLVGFYDDGQTVVHLHPTGPELLDATLRGGPVLNFAFFPPKGGFLRLYCQVQVDGKMIFVPFGIDVAP